MSATVTHPYQVVCLDMDGTMLNNEHEVSERTKNTLVELSARGVTIAIATGRSFSSVIEYLQPLELSQPEIAVICFNGSVCRLVNTKTWETVVLFQDLIAEDQFRELLLLTQTADKKNEVQKPIHSSLEDALAAAEQHAASVGGESNVGVGEEDTPIDCIVQYYNGATGEVSVAAPSNQIHTQMMEKYAKLTGKTQTTVASFEPYLSPTPHGIHPKDQVLPVKALVLTPEPDRFIAMCKRPVSEGGISPQSFHYFRGSPHAFFVEFLKPGATKGTAIKRLGEHLKIDLSAFICFGDGENDAEMLKAAGCGVAMKNGRPKAKEWGDCVSEFTNQQDGVAKHLEHLFGLQEYSES